MLSDEQKSVKVNFIVGPGRSGTALMVWILNTHPNCLALPEIKHVTHFFRKYKNIVKVTHELITDLKQYYAGKIGSNKLKVFAFDYESFFAGLKVGEDINYEQLCKKIYLSYSTFLFPNKKPTTIIDKNPLYSTRVDDLARIFKDAKFLFILRDPRAYVLSTYENIGHRGKLISAHIYSFFWTNHMRLIHKNQKKRAANCMVLRYEDFISNASHSVKEVSGFFDLSYSDSMLEYYKAFEQNMATLEANVPKWRIKKLKKLTQPINPTRVSSWEKSLSEGEVKRIEFWCSKAAKQFNYAPTKNISLAEKFQYFIEGFPICLIIRAHFYLSYLGFFIHPKKRKF